MSFQYRIPNIKIRRFHDLLITIMDFIHTWKDLIYIETNPGSYCELTGLWVEYPLMNIVIILSYIKSHVNWLLLIQMHHRTLRNCGACSHQRSGQSIILSEISLAGINASMMRLWQPTTNPLRIYKTIIIWNDKGVNQAAKTLHIKINVYDLQAILQFKYQYG